MTSSLYDSFPVGGVFKVKSESQSYEGLVTVLQHDTSDQEAPLLVDKVDENENPLNDPFWVGFDQITTAEETVRPRSSRVKTAENLSDKLASDLIKASRLAAELAEKIAAGKPKLFEPGGVCAACFGDVTFSIQTGVWSHVSEPDEKHDIPTVIIGASKEV